MPTIQFADREPDLSFAIAQAKVLWAEQNIKTLQSWIEEWIKAQRDAGLPLFRVDGDSVFVGTQNPPLNFALKASEITFHLRSALDCCWMGLRRARGDEGTGAKTLPRDNGRKGVRVALEKAGVESAFQGVSTIILDGIAAYEGGNDILWLVAQIDNWNKHNSIALTSQVTKAHNVIIANESATITIDELISGGNTPGPMIVNASGEVFELKNNPDILVEIILELQKPAEKRPIMPLLTAALQETSKAVEQLVVAFGQKTS